ncbi:MAG: hypothetical protein ACOX23_02860 [Peptococcia bacterium]|jgi:predicted P-loop ATPase/GTPase
MNERKTALIETFISKVKEKYPSLIIDYEFCSETGEYDIWHTDSRLQFEDHDFLKYVGKLMQEILFDNNLFEFCFGYDHLKFKELSSSYNYDVIVNEVETVLINDGTKEIEFYITNDDSVKLTDLKLFYNRKNKLKNFNVPNEPENLLIVLEQSNIYVNNQDERLVA